MEHWSQVTIETRSSPDREALRRFVGPLITRLRPHLEAWHFFWEPDLWVRPVPGFLNAIRVPPVLDADLGPAAPRIDESLSNARVGTDSWYYAWCLR